jgi:hypothetical protein
MGVKRKAGNRLAGASREKVIIRVMLKDPASKQEGESPSSPTSTIHSPLSAPVART